MNTVDPTRTQAAIASMTTSTRQIADLLNTPRSVDHFLSPNATNLIKQLEAALVSLQVEQLHQQAIAQGIWDFFPRLSHWRNNCYRWLSFNLA